METPGTIGKYELGELIGRGATGKVYRATDTFSGQTVAFKLVDRAVLQDPRFDVESRRQFLNEASLAGRLNHPHIVAILDAAVTDPGYVVMEYVTGGNLAQFTRADGLLGPEAALEVLFKCCGALDYAFRQGIIHRDIKPANVMVAGGTDVKIADFGAALFYRADTTQIASVGTPYYMSPEHIHGEEMTHLSDMYSLGVLGYELLTGRKPFTGDSLPELLAAITHEDAPPPSSYRKGLPPALDELVLRMIAKRPEARYADWAELALRIAELGGFSGTQRSVPDSERFQRLRAMPSFEELSDPEIWELARACAWRRVPARTPIISEGDADVGSMYVLADGQAKVTRGGRLLNVLNRGELFGEMAYIQRRGQRHTTIESMSECTVAELSFERLGKVSNGLELKFCKLLLRTLADRLSLADARILQNR